ncbi:hypothetical protein HTZ85_21430 [Escherichia coli]|nr:hypothetical protein [Escherichia coli]
MITGHLMITFGQTIKDNYRRDENDVYDIADYYQNDFGRKNSFSANMSQSLPEGWGVCVLKYVMARLLGA